MKKRIAKKLDKKRVAPSKNALTPVQLVDSWKKHEAEPRLANEMALAYVRQTAFMLGVDIDRVDLLKTFGTKTGDMIVDRTDLNVRLFETIKKMPKRKFRVSPAKHPAVLKAQELKLAEASIVRLTEALRHPFWTNFVIEAEDRPCGTTHSIESLDAAGKLQKVSTTFKAYLWFTTSVPVVMLRSLPSAEIKAVPEENRDGYGNKAKLTTEAWADLGHYAIRLPLRTSKGKLPGSLSDLEGGKIGIDAHMFAFSGNKLPKKSSNPYESFGTRLHPHLDRPNGGICWGDAAEEYNRMKGTGDLLRLLDILNLLLREPVTNNWEHNHFEKYRSDPVTVGDIQNHNVCDCWAHPFVRNIPKDQLLIFKPKA